MPEENLPTSAQGDETDGKHSRNDMELESLDGNHGFRAFMRQSLEFTEDFSVGLEYLPKDEPGRFCLVRCNGMHGGHQVHPHHGNATFTGARLTT